MINILLPPIIFGFLGAVNLKYQCLMGLPLEETFAVNIILNIFSTY